MFPLELVLPAFIAGLITFFAPCTLPLVPGYLGFISGVSVKDFTKLEENPRVRSKVVFNGLLYIAGFSLVFVLLGSLFGLVGSFLVEYRVWLEKIGGVFIIFFGLYLMNIFKFKGFRFLNKDKRINVLSRLSPGRPVSSFIFGMTFALGWTPCIGPVLGSILLLATTTNTIGQGAILLTVFSLGLAVPFLLLAVLIGQAVFLVRKLVKFLRAVSFIGGLFLIFLGVLILTGKTGLYIGKFYKLFEFLNYESRLLDFL